MILQIILPQRWCPPLPPERAMRGAAGLAFGMRAYSEAKRDFTPEQRPLWEKCVIAQTEQQKERQLCSALKPGDETTVLDRLGRIHQFL